MKVHKGEGTRLNIDFHGDGTLYRPNRR